MTDDFTTQLMTPLNEEAFVQKHWHRALRTTGVRPRKFYATRHRLISAAVTNVVEGADTFGVFRM